MNVVYEFTDHIGCYTRALHYALENNSRIARQGWNGKKMFVFAVFPYGADNHTPYSEMQSCLTKKEIKAYDPLPFLVMKTADDKLVPWLCSQTDAIANDWYLVKADFLDNPGFGPDDEDNPDYVAPIDPSEIV